VADSLSVRPLVLLIKQSLSTACGGLTGCSNPDRCADQILGASFDLGVPLTPVRRLNSTKKSQATIDAAWALRNCCQLSLERVLDANRATGESGESGESGELAPPHPDCQLPIRASRNPRLHANR
jgi:hypothetical protein